MESKIPQEALEFIIQQGTIVSNGKTYAFLPFWFEIADLSENTVFFHPLEDLPADLKDAINTNGSFGVMSDPFDYKHVLEEIVVNGHKPHAAVKIAQDALKKV